MAQRLSPQHTMELEIPNTMLKDGKILAACEAMAPRKRAAPRSVETKAVKAARPAEPTQASDAENDVEHEQLVEAATAEDVDEEENLETHKPYVVFRSTPKHHGSTVVAHMSDDCKRSAQILSITFSRASKVGQSPRDICDSVVETLRATD